MITYNLILCSLYFVEDDGGTNNPEWSFSHWVSYLGHLLVLEVLVGLIELLTMRLNSLKFDIYCLYSIQKCTIVFTNEWEN